MLGQAASAEGTLKTELRWQHRKVAHVDIGSTSTEVFTSFLCCSFTFVWHYALPFFLDLVPQLAAPTFRQETKAPLAYAEGKTA